MTEFTAPLVLALLRTTLMLSVAAVVCGLLLRGSCLASPRKQAMAWAAVLMQGWLWIGINVDFLRSDGGGESQHLPSMTATGSPGAFPGASADGDRSSTERSREQTQVQRWQRAGLTTRVFADIERGMRWVASHSAWPAALWATGMVVWAAWFGGRYVLFLSRLTSSRRACGAWEKELLSALRDLGVARPVRLRVTDHHGPLLVRRWGESQIVVPESFWVRLSPVQRKAILRHELAHLVRGDLWKSLACRVLAAPHWFNPLAWWAVRQFEQCCEMACDDAASRTEPDMTVEYAKALLLLGQLTGLRTSHVSAAYGGQLGLRIRRLLTPVSMEETAMTRTLLLGAIVSLTILGLVRIQLTAEERPQTARTAAAADENAGEVPTPQLRNAGFEEVERGVPSGWFATNFRPTAGQYDFSCDTEVAHTGKRSVAVEIMKTHPDQPVAYNWTTTVERYTAGTSYDISCWIKTKDVKHSPFLVVQCWEKATGKLLSIVTTQRQSPVIGTADWTKVTTRILVPEGTTELRLRAGLDTHENRGSKAWFDDFAIQAVDKQ